MKTTKEIYEQAFVKDRLFWINDTDDDKEFICSMDNNPKNNVKWFSVSDVEQLQERHVLDTQRLLSEIQKELKKHNHFIGREHEEYVDDVINKFKSQSSFNDKVKWRPLTQ